MEKQCKKVFPINNCIIRKVKTVKRPRFDSIKYFLHIVGQLNSMQADTVVATRPREEEAKTATGTGNLLAA